MTRLPNIDELLGEVLDAAMDEKVASDTTETVEESGVELARALNKLAAAIESSTADVTYNDLEDFKVWLNA